MSDKESDRASSPVSSELETEPMLPLSDQCAHESSYGPSHKSDTEEQSDEDKSNYNEHCENEEEGGKSMDNMSLEVEANDSLHNVSIILPDEVQTVKQQAADSSQDVLGEDSEIIDGSPKLVKKRKSVPSDNSPVLKRFHRNPPPETLDTSEKSVEFVSESLHQTNNEGVVVNISSTSEKTINLEDSQEYSLRLEEISTSPQLISDKYQEGCSWKSHTKEEKITLEQAALSQKSAGLCSQEHSLSWSSHKGQEDEISPNSKIENEENFLSSPINNSLTTEHFKAKVVKVDGDSGGKRQEVFEERLTQCGIIWVMEDNKVLYGEIKEVKVLDEVSGNEKPGRMSIMSSSSCKSSSSSGSVGLPGPFSLPGYTHSRLSITSSSEGGHNRPGWDGPFLKPTMPVLKPLLVCSHCHCPFSHAENASSPVQNGNAQLSKTEELVREKSTRRRVRGKVSFSAKKALRHINRRVFPYWPTRL